MDRNPQLAASSRDSYLALRRVERQQHLIQRLHAVRGERIRLARLANDLGASERTIAATSNGSDSAACRYRRIKAAAAE